MGYLHEVQRTFVPGTAIITEINRVYEQKSYVASIVYPKTPEKISNEKNIREKIDDIVACLEVKRGLKGSPLAYVIRKNEWLDETTRNLPDGTFISINEEPIARSRLT